MKRQIRANVFETNSSSTHSLVLLMKEDYDKWQNDEIFHIRFKWGNFKNIDGDWITKEELIEIAKEKGYEDSVDNIDELIEFFNGDVETYDSFGEDFEYFEDELTTPNGEKVIAVGYFGYDS